jgi:ABC-type transport system involved in multi-copper enzyme maturation permease subunit
MTTTSIPSANIALATPAPTPVPIHAVRAEWAKLRTLRATWLTLSISVVAGIALGGLGSLSDARAWDDMTAEERLAHDPTSTSLIGVLFGALVLGALGVRTITSEYSTGMIRTTATAQPNRSLILWSKLAVVASVTFVIAAGGNVAGFSLGQAALGTKDIGASITSADSLVAIVLGTVAVTSFAIIGLGLGTIVRRAAVANILIAVVVIGGQLVGSAIPSDSQRYLPFNALQASVTVKRGDDLLPPGAAVAFLVGYAAIAIAGATLVLRRRDV